MNPLLFRSRVLRLLRNRVAPAMLCLSIGAASASSGDSRILAARDASRANNKAKLAQLAAESGAHPLDQYVEYWNLRAQIETLGAEEVLGFNKLYEGSYLADRLLGEWLKQQGKERNWALFDANFAKLQDTDPELRCYALHSRYLAGEPTALAQMRAMWLSADLPDACHQMMLAPISEGKVKSEEIAERVRRLAEAKRLTAAKAAAQWLPASEMPDARALDQAVGDPARYLDRLPANFSTNAGTRLAAMVAVARLARSDAAAAGSRWQGIDERFTGVERGWVNGYVGMYAAQQHQPDAVKWFKATHDATLNQEQMEWRVRAGLRAGDWKFVKTSIEAMPEEQRKDAAWTYWLGRAKSATGQKEAAAEDFLRIAGQPTFYGLLAGDELGAKPALPARASKPSNEEFLAAANDPSIKRALLLFKFGNELRTEAVREWNWALRGKDDRFLLAAADVALKNEIFDRAVNTADRTSAEHNFDLRYLAPFREVVAPRAAEQNLDAAWVYGLMRQESRFVPSIRSSAGAAGLMQLMPATARWMAGRIGYKEYSPSRITDVDTNVLLGTSYLATVLGELDDHPVLASAAYNAGPGRARKWRADRPLEGAIYAETIPFNETRDYVKKVMSNAVYYAVLLDGKSASLKSRLGTVQPKNGAEPVTDTP